MFEVVFLKCSIKYCLLNPDPEEKQTKKESQGYDVQQE